MAVILLVEDEDQVRVLAESFLQTAGHTTRSAGSIEQTLALLPLRSRSTSYSLI